MAAGTGAGRYVSNPIARRIVRRGERRHARPKEIVSALETGIVESGLRNLPGGDADSAGWRQERASLYRNPRNVRASIDRYYDETRAAGRGRGMTAGELAARVQRPAAQYRGRYHQQRGTALALYRALKSGRGGRGGRVVGGTPPSISRSAQQPGGSALAELAVKALAKPQGPPSFTAMAPPPFSAKVTLPLGQAMDPLQGGTVTPVEGTPLAEKLAAARADANVTDAASTVTPGTPGVRGKLPGRTAYVGDSLGVGTAPYLRRFGKVRADVREGRSSRDAVHALRRFRGYDRVVFDVGTNDGSAAQLARSLRRAARVSGGAELYVPRLHGPGAAAKNAVLARLARQGVIRVLRPGTAGVGSDGIHYSGEGYEARAARLAAQLGLRRGGPSGGRLVGSPRDRPGVRTNRAVLNFVKEVSAQARRPITLGTGSAHDRLTSSGNVSDHWDGNALDLPARGRRLTRLGRAALVRAGMPKAQARRARGGIYNLVHKGWRIQVIFNAPDHDDHLHVGLHRL